MKIWKLVAGILSIIFSVIVFFQSMLVGTANTLSSNGEVGGSEVNRLCWTKNN